MVLESFSLCWQWECAVEVLHIIDSPENGQLLVPTVTRSNSFSLVSIDSQNNYQLGNKHSNHVEDISYSNRNTTLFIFLSALLPCKFQTIQQPGVFYQMLLFGDDTALYFGSASFDAIWKLPQNRKPEQILHSLHGFPFWGES